MKLHPDFLGKRSGDVVMKEGEHRRVCVETEDCRVLDDEADADREEPNLKAPFTLLLFF